MNTAWTVQIDEDGIAWVTFDLSGQKVNKFTAVVMAELDQLVDRLENDRSIQAVTILSGKSDNFIAGADIAELAAIDGVDDARDKAHAGQRLFEKLARLGPPTVAVIHGTCMGGGTEMALACDYRLATDDPKTSIGLPEVNLGIVPGWGGTQRLPRVVGLTAALKMIMSGRPVSSDKAYKMGLVDGLVAHAFLQEQTRQFLARTRTKPGRRRVIARRRRSRVLSIRLAEQTPPGRAWIYRQAARQAHERTKGHYPAPLEALDVIRRSLGRPLEEGLSIEAETFSRLAPSSVSRNLVWVFQASQQAKKAYVVTADGPRSPIAGRAAVVGAGVMGGGIAWALSQAGLSVCLKDVAWDATAKGMAAAASMFGAMTTRGKMTKGQANLAMHRITPAIGFEGFATGMDCVIEAVVEDMAVKKRVLKEIETHVSTDTLICTNTSSLSISQMATALERPDRLVGLHFFNPVNRMPLVEVIPGEHTSPQAVTAAVALARRLNKTAVVVRDRAGFLVNRILLPYVNESVRMFQEGIDPSRIDRLIEAFGMPMGPLTLADEVGLDVGLKVAEVLQNAFGSRMGVPEVLRAAVASGNMLGKKTGRGLYVYRGGGKKPNPKAADLVRQVGVRHSGVVDLSDQQIVDRAILTMVNEAARCLDEQMVQDAQTLDMAMLMGAGFAPFRGGLLRWADQEGSEVIVKRLGSLASAFGDRFEPAALLGRLAAQDGRFYQEPAG